MVKLRQHGHIGLFNKYSNDPYLI